MSKLIDFKYTSDNKVCTDVSRLLIFIKYMFLNCKKNNLFYYPEGYMLPVRWSSLKNKLVIDLGTDLDRDIQGIDLENFKGYFSKSIEYLEILKKLLLSIENKSLENYYNIEKNQSKFIAVVYCLNSEQFYNLGLYSFTKSNKRQGLDIVGKKSVLIDNSEDFKCKINSYLDLITPSKSCSLKDYRALYKNFTSFILNKTYTFSLEGRKINIDMKSIISSNTKFVSSLSNKRVKEILNTKTILAKEEKYLTENLIRHIIDNELFNFLLQNNIIKSNVYFYDNKTGVNYKIKKASEVKTLESNKKLTDKPEYNISLLIPAKF